MLRSRSPAGNSAVGNARCRRAAQSVPSLRSIGTTSCNPCSTRKKRRGGYRSRSPARPRAVFNASFRRRHFFEELLLEELDFVVVLELVFFAATFLEELVFLTAVFRLDVFFGDFTDFLEELFLVEVTFLELLDEAFFSLDLEWPDLASAFLAAAASASVPLTTTCLGVGRYVMGFICLLS